MPAIGASKCLLTTYIRAETRGKPLQTRACDNQVLKNKVEVLAAEWLCDDKERGQPQKGLYYTGSGILAKGTWIATFGVLRESTTMAQNNGYSLLVRVGESGESTQGSRWPSQLV